MPLRRKKSLQSYCSVNFDFLAFMGFDMAFDGHHVVRRLKFQ